MNVTARILIADDDAGMRASLCRYLENEGYECVVVSNAREAEIELRRSVFDLLLSDINMPGNEHLELIRQLPRMANDLPVILLTGCPTMETATASVRLPVFAYLTKPPPLEELKTVVAEAVASGREARGSNLDWQTMQDLSADLTAEISKARREMGVTLVGPAAGAVHDQIGLALENLLAALTKFRGGDAKAARVESPGQVEWRLEMMTILRETVDVLEQTKRSFKSRQLRVLREKLQAVLRPPPSPVSDQAPTFPLNTQDRL
jgi:CheY-like chemotaxis protein